MYSPDFILRKKLSFSDVNICLDRCNNAGVVDKFHVSIICYIKVMEKEDYVNYFVLNGITIE